MAHHSSSSELYGCQTRQAQVSAPIVQLQRSYLKYTTIFKCFWVQRCCLALLCAWLPLVPEVADPGASLSKRRAAVRDTAQLFASSPSQGDSCSEGQRCAHELRVHAREREAANPALGE